MTASRTSETVNWRGAFIGAALFFAMSLLVRYWVLESPPSLAWLAGTFTVAGALIGHLGLRNAVYIVGASCGLALGLFVGAIIGDETGRYIPVEEQETKNLEGQKIEIKGPTLDGGQFNVEDWHGKIVLVDFWATWCGPCIAELPNVKSAYDKYHKDGFEVVGVSLDENPGRLAEFVRDKNIPWPQIIFEEPSQRKWDNPLVRKYDIHGIPATFLLDKDGHLVSTDVRGSKLTAMLEQLHTGVRVGLFPMGLFIGACVGGFVGIQLGDFLERVVRRKRTTPVS